MLSRIMTFVKHINLCINLIEKLNSSFFFSPQTLFESKTHYSLPILKILQFLKTLSPSQKLDNITCLVFFSVFF